MAALDAPLPRLCFPALGFDGPLLSDQQSRFARRQIDYVANSKSAQADTIDDFGELPCDPHEHLAHASALFMPPAR